jgi:hypothetical protein
MKIENNDMVHIERITERLINGAKYFAGAQDTATLNQLQRLVAEVRHFALSVNRSRFPDEDEQEYQDAYEAALERFAKIFIN